MTSNLLGIICTDETELVTVGYVYVNKDLYSRHRLDLEIQNTECIWIEVSTQYKKELLGKFYRSPNSPSNTLVTIEKKVRLTFRRFSAIVFYLPLHKF